MISSRRTPGSVFVFALLCFQTISFSVLADEQITPIAVSGDWIALAHRDSMTSPPDVCVVSNAKDNVAFRADADDIEVRISDDKWSLPASVTGSIELKVGSFNSKLDISSNTDTMVSAVIQKDQIASLFQEMDKAGSMLVTVGKEKPRGISLVGSSKATNAFRTCAKEPLINTLLPRSRIDL